MTSKIQEVMFTPGQYVHISFGDDLERDLKDLARLMAKAEITLTGDIKKTREIINSFMRSQRCYSSVGRALAL